MTSTAWCLPWIIGSTRILPERWSARSDTCCAIGQYDRVSRRPRWTHQLTFELGLATLVIAVAYASLDEWHQSFVPLRHASPGDAAIDAFGALLAQIFVWLYANWKWNFAAPPGVPGSVAKQ